MWSYYIKVFPDQTRFRNKTELLKNLELKYWDFEFFDDNPPCAQFSFTIDTNPTLDKYGHVFTLYAMWYPTIKKMSYEYAYDG